MDSKNLPAELSLRNLYLLDPDVIFLNHGSFGAVPRPVFEIYQEWQRQLERQPVSFLATDLMSHLQEARKILGAYLHAPADDLAFVPNATVGVNIVARSLRLSPGDEILTTDHEYGACDNILSFVAEKSGAQIVRRHVALPIIDANEIVEQLWQGVTAHTRLIFISHITSFTALTMPVEALCERARQQGILTLIDGAHAPGQLPLDLESLGANFYTGNCHKWLCAPRSSGFLYVRHELQKMIDPLVVSWGWGENNPFNSGSAFLDNLQWSGTFDPSAYLSVPSAIAFQQQHNWPEVIGRCHSLVKDTLWRVSDLTGLPSIYPDDRFYRQMAAIKIPTNSNIDELKRRLIEEYRVEIPVVEWQDHKLIRLSVQGYNTPSDTDRLIEALRILLPQVSR